MISVPLKSLESALKHESRPWRTVSAWLEAVAVDLEFPLDESSEGEALAQAASSLGYSVKSERVEELKKSVGHEAKELLSIGIHYGPVIFTAYKTVKSLLDVPDEIRKLREKVRPYWRRAVRIAPPLQLPVVESWLTRTYGSSKWRVDASKVEAKSIMGVCVFIVPEQSSGKTHFLAVDGDECEELPASWLPTSHEATKK